MIQRDWLFPHTARKVGWLCSSFLLALCVALQSKPGQEYSDAFQNWFDENIWSGYNETLNNVLIIGFAMSLILIAFSREKQEDEMIQKLRLQALQWSIYVNYSILILCSLLFYFVDFFNVLIFNMYTVLIVFILIFRWTLYQMNKEAIL